MAMTRPRTAFFCTECGNEFPRWQGRCPACEAWNTLVEEPVRTERAAGHERGRGPARDTPVAQRLAEVDARGVERWSSGLGELDFVLGGGLVPGSVVLVGGEPGIGKSTLLLQVAGHLESAGRPTLYVSGEESAAQVRLRADRLGRAAGDVAFLGETEVDRILAGAQAHGPAVLVIDSIQTIYSEALDGAPGNVTQVRECAARLQRFAKQEGVAVFLVGHVTKGGVVAGPRTLEHMVDTVLYFEGAEGLDHRVLRATKNRFGSIDEIGVFRMTPQGLVPVSNPSELFLRERSEVSGSAVTATMEGSRPLLVEVQALCTPASYGAAQRAATGFDRQRLSLLLAVLEKRAGIGFGQLDVFLNVVGGVRVVETGADVAVAMALASSAADRALPGDAIFVGEVGLGGELRGVSQMERRLAEATRLGFRCAYVPARWAPGEAADNVVTAPDVRTLVERVLGE
jgi:DNA repair protein RadA/Sms